MESTNSGNHERLIYVFDLDGVVYRGNELLPHVDEVIAAIRRRGHLVWFFTNNATKSRETYSIKLGSMGIPASVEEIMTSAYATALYFLENGLRGQTVYRIGERGLAAELEGAGLNVLAGDDEPDAHIDAVVVGLDRTFTYDKLARAQNAILGGAKFVATNEDATFPLENDTLAPGAGCMVAAVRTATSVTPFVIGKPETYAFNKILDIAGVPASHCIVIGDRLDTDILVGNRGGAETVLVTTGINSRQEGECAFGDLEPHRIIDSLVELC